MLLPTRRATANAPIDPATQDWFTQHSKWFYVTFSLVAASITIFCLWRLHRGPNRSFFPCKCCGKRDKADWSTANKEKADSKGWGSAEAARKHLGGMKPRNVYLTDLKRESEAAGGESSAALSPLPPRIAQPPPPLPFPISPAILTPTRGILKKTSSYSPTQRVSPMYHPPQNVYSVSPIVTSNARRETTSSFGNTEGIISPPMSVHVPWGTSAYIPETAFSPTQRPFPTRERDLQYRSGPAYPPPEPPSLHTMNTSANHTTSLPPLEQAGYPTPIAAKFARTISTQSSTPISSPHHLTPQLRPEDHTISSQASPSFRFPSYQDMPSLPAPSHGVSPLRSSASVQYNVHGQGPSIASRHRLGPGRTVSQSDVGVWGYNGSPRGYK